MLIDSHVHVTHVAPDDVQRQIDEARRLGSRLFVEVSTTAANARRVAEFVETRDDFYGGVAVHPWQVETYADGDLAVLRRLLLGSKKMVCVGECGLDYSRADGAIAERQRALFRDMVRLAREVGLPLNLHCDRDSVRDVLAILREERADEVGGMMHNFAGNLDHARGFLDLGFYVSACIMIHHPLAERLRGVYRELSLGQLVLDSDAPGAKFTRLSDDEPPYPYDMDRVSELRMLRYIADKVAEVKGIPAEEVEAATTRNTLRLFKLPTPQ